MFKKFILAALLVGTAASSFVFADTPVINQKIRNQRKRIHQGVKSGTLTPAQAAALKQTDKDVRHEKADMIKSNGGKPLTSEQRKLLRQDLRKNSRKIYREKHSNSAPATTTPPAAPAGQ